MHQIQCWENVASHSISLTWAVGIQLVYAYQKGNKNTSIEKKSDCLVGLQSHSFGGCLCNCAFNNSLFCWQSVVAAVSNLKDLNWMTLMKDQTIATSSGISTVKEPSVQVINGQADIHPVFIDSSSTWCDSYQNLKAMGCPHLLNRSSSMYRFPMVIHLASVLKILTLP